MNQDELNKGGNAMCTAREQNTSAAKAMPKLAMPDEVFFSRKNRCFLTTASE